MIPTGASTQDECGGIRAGPLPCRLRRIASLNWREVDRATAAKEWPRQTCALRDRLRRSLRVSKSSQLESTDAAVNTPPVLLWSSRPRSPVPLGSGASTCISAASSKRVAFDALAELVAAVVPERPKAKVLEGWGASDSVDRSRYMALWTTSEDTFVLDATVDEYNRGSKAWYGRFALRRRWQLVVRETWTLDAGSWARILSIETTRPSDSRKKAFFRVRYLTDCLNDSSCQTREAGQLWPRLRSLAEHQGAQEVSVWADDCALDLGGVSAQNAAPMENGPAVSQSSLECEANRREWPSNSGLQRAALVAMGSSEVILVAWSRESVCAVRLPVPPLKPGVRPHRRRLG